MPGALHRFLQEDHARLDGLLARAAGASGAIDVAIFDEFCAGLFRHIAMEEKVLLAGATKLRGGVPLECERRLRADHAALGALMVPTPTRDTIASIRSILAEHNPIEEGPGGLYDVCEQLFGTGCEDALVRLHAVANARAPRHVDGPHVQDGMAKLLRARAAARDEDTGGKAR
jgi:hypothetical protein